MNASRGAWLITSGAYVGQELAAEFGLLPPAFLPVGIKRLYEYQVERLSGECPIYLSLPETFSPPPHDIARLEALRVSVLLIPEGLSLGEAVVFALNLIGLHDEPIRILHGDTLIEERAMGGMDEVGIAADREGYSWAEATLQGERIVDLETVRAGIPSERGLPVVCGYFAFARSAALVRAITRARGDFIKGISTYGAEYELTGRTVEEWFDFGHLQTYFRSRRLVATTRAFNSLAVDGRVARKSSADVSKMRAEANWLANIPPAIRIYSARLIDQGDIGERAYYETEYEYLPTLSELFVFGTLSRLSWTSILQSCNEYLAVCGAHKSSDRAADAVRELVITKTAERLRQYADRTGFDIDAMLRYAGRPLPSLMQIAADLEQHIDIADGERQTVMHGDFCFSNILYNSRVQRIRVIDPRGYVSAQAMSLYGDIRYDLAKLAHSVIGRYDQIIAGRYSMPAACGAHYDIEFEVAPHHAWLEAAMPQFEVCGLSADSQTVRAMNISLFLSMLPLHADRPDRQRAFIANALRLYAKLEVV